MKPVLLITAVFIVATLSCKKSDDNNTTTVPPGGGSGTGSTERYWRVGGTAGTVYPVNNYTWANETYSAYDTAMNSINFSFATYPPPAGNYLVVADSVPLGANQVKMYIGKSGSNANTYVATGFSGTSAVISFEDSRIKIVLPATWAKKPGSNDSVSVAATLPPFQ